MQVRFVRITPKSRAGAIALAAGVVVVGGVLVVIGATLLLALGAAGAVIGAGALLYRKLTGRSLLGARVARAEEMMRRAQMGLDPRMEIEPRVHDAHRRPSGGDSALPPGDQPR
jgi:uncharacterized protein (DUF58 family)